jgi:DNA-binding MarR family transcriptional regulator
MVRHLSENQFFKPTVLYKEYMILDMIEKNQNITQREMSKVIGISVSVVNDYLDTYEKNKLIIRKKHSTKTVEYFVTKKGGERRKVLNFGYLHSSQQLYNSAKENIEDFIFQIEKKGLKKLILYGAGEICEIIINTIKWNSGIKLMFEAIIDDDISKIGKTISGVKIINKIELSNYEYDAILISSYSNKDIIKDKILDIHIHKNKILSFFD